MIIKEEKMKIFVETISHLRKKFTSDKEQSETQDLENDRLTGKYQKLSLA